MKGTGTKSVCLNGSYEIVCPLLLLFFGGGGIKHHLVWPQDQFPFGDV